MGKKKQPHYRIVVADARAPRDGKFIESLGFYQPQGDKPIISVNEERLLKWLKNGAQLTDTVRALLSKLNILQKLRISEEQKQEK